ncbi:hypothetical protein N665_0188s0181 [Sinapis alba]|nr:hypothetical protein N665_0188s0181 [Sinapis alba]
MGKAGLKLFNHWIRNNSHQERRLLGEGLIPDWADTLAYIQQTCLCPLDSVLVRMVFQTTIYNVWRERNGKRHQRPWASVEQLTHLIRKKMRNRINSLIYGSNHKFEGLLPRWFEVTTA